MLTKNFDCVYIINLPDREDRRKEMVEQLESIGDDPAAKNLVFFPAIRPVTPDGFPSAGARGCFLSHLAVLKDAQSNNHKKILILEDDCNFSKILRLQQRRFSEIVSAENWHFLYGGLIGAEKIREADVLLGTEEIPPQKPIMGAHFIAMTKLATSVTAKYLTEILDRAPGDPAGGPMHVDGAYSWVRKDHIDLRTLMLTPHAVYQRSSRTDIHPHTWLDKTPFIRSGVRLARRLKNAWNTQI